MNLINFILLLYFYTHNYTTTTSLVLKFKNVTVAFDHKKCNATQRTYVNYFLQ